MNFGSKLSAFAAIAGAILGGGQSTTHISREPINPFKPLDTYTPPPKIKIKRPKYRIKGVRRSHARAVRQMTPGYKKG